MLKFARAVFRFVALPAVLIVAAALAWLRWDAGRPLDEWFDERHGSLAQVDVIESAVDSGQLSELLQLHSSSGLAVRARVIRPVSPASRLQVLVVLGGHRTGSDAARLFGRVGQRAVVALDYPYDGPEKVSGFGQVLEAVPLARRAFTDTPPATSLLVDWILEQHWADTERLFVVGASLGVPFAALTAARDKRISGAMLVHGAADNLAWIETQVARRNDAKILHRPLATIIYWLAYGPTFDTAANVAKIAPRPVIVIGARADERTPAGQTEALYAAASEPRTLRWTAGRHIQPNRADIVAELLAIANELLPARPTD
jgi:dienelactone hydrolase